MDMAELQQGAQHLSVRRTMDTRALCAVSNTIFRIAGLLFGRFISLCASGHPGPEGHG